MKIFTTALLLSAACLPTLTLACDRDAGPGRCGPPAEAVAACEGLAENSACQFTGRRDRVVAGECRTLPRGEAACVPEDHLARMDRAPRQRGEQ